MADASTSRISSISASHHIKDGENEEMRFQQVAAICECLCHEIGDEKAFARPTLKTYLPILQKLVTRWEAGEA